MGRKASLIRLAGSLFLFQVAGTMFYVSLPLLMGHSYGYGLVTALVLTCELLPGVVAAGPISALLRRFRPQQVASVSAVICAAAFAAFPVAHSLAFLCVLAAIAGTAYAAERPALMALRPHVIAEGDEMAGNGWIVAAERFAAFVGPAVAAAIAVSSLTAVFVVQTAGILVATLLLLAGPWLIPPTVETGEPTDLGLRALFLDPITELRALLAENRVVRALTLTAFGYVAAVGASRLLLIARGHALFSGGDGLGYLVAAMAIGATAGALLAKRVSELMFLKPWHIYVFGNLLEALCWPAIAATRGAVVALVLMFIAGVLESIATVVYYAEVQASLADSQIGSYFAWLSPCTGVCIVLGTLLSGALIDASPLTLAIAMSALIGGPIILTLRPLRQIVARSNESVVPKSPETVHH